MKNKSITLILFFAFLYTDILGQVQTVKSLYFAEDSAFYMGCGVMTFASVLIFKSDTAKRNKAACQYNIVIECPELYGKDFFKKGRKYKLLLTKDYKKMSSYFSTTIFAKNIRKRKNLFFCKKIFRE